MANTGLWRFFASLIAASLASLTPPRLKNLCFKPAASVGHESFVYATSGFCCTAAKAELTSLPPAATWCYPSLKRNIPMGALRISTGHNPPEDINVVIEIPEGSSVKYEIDKDSGMIFVDRFLFTSHGYPAAYGFVPNTLAADGDPVDALVLVPSTIVPGAVIRARPIGILHMTDEAGQDEKIICVPHNKVHPLYSDVRTVENLPEIQRQNIKHFFETYKDLEPGKWVKVTGFGTLDEAHDAIRKAIEAGRKE
jgi:inorganic pyrophosphatase